MRISDWSSDVCSSDLLEVRYTSGGGGIRWIWDADAGVTFMSRSVGASGSATSGSQTNVADMYWRSFSSFTTVVNSNHLNTFTTNRGMETLVVEGSISEGRRGGKGGVSTCRSRWSAYT